MPEPTYQQVGGTYTQAQTGATRPMEPAFVPPLSKKRLYLRGMPIPHAAWYAIEDEAKGEYTDEMKDQLILALIDYASAASPGRFRNVRQALAYFNIRSEKQIDRMNKLAQDIERENQKEPVKWVSDADLGISPNTTPTRAVYAKGDTPKPVVDPESTPKRDIGPEEKPEPLIEDDHPLVKDPLTASHPPSTATQQTTPPSDKPLGTASTSSTQPQTSATAAKTSAVKSTDEKTKNEPPSST